METIYDVLTAIEKIGDVTDLPLDRDTGTRFDPEQMPNIAIHMQGVSYRFLGENEDFLKDINLHVLGGDKICLSGYNGSGKSLLLQFLAGLYDEFRGNLSYNDIPIGNWYKEDLHKVIGDNLIKEEIFKGTLYENITLGKPYITQEEVQDIVKVVGLDSFVSSQKSGYNTHMIPEGRNLPKSTRLKIILARCLVGKPKIILVENSFNLLKDVNKKSFIDYLLQTDATVVTISNDVNIAGKFKRNVVMKDGAIIADTSFEALKSETWFKEVFEIN